MFFRLRRRVALSATLLTVVAALVTGSAAPARTTTTWPGGTWSPPPATYGVKMVADVAFPMSDGARLYGNVYYPADLQTGDRSAQRFPVILTITPYNTGGLGGANGKDSMFVNSAYFAARGYISVIVDAPGTGRSGGVDEFLSPTAQRYGAELIQQVAHGLDGSDGRVALMGCSYLGEWALFNAANAALAGPSPVKAAAAQCSSGDFFREFFNVGGLMTSDWYGGEGFFGASDASPGTSEPTGTALYHAWSLYQHFFTSVTNSATGGDHSYDGLWWRQRSPLYKAQDIVANRIPVLQMTSYQDIFPAGALEMNAALQNLEAGRPQFAPLAGKASPRYQVIIGPGTHGSGLSDDLALEWFDTWLKGVNTGWQRIVQPLHFWEDAAKRWIDTDRYPLVQRYSSLYLGASGTLTSAAPTTAVGSDSLTWAPDQSVSYTTAPFSQTQLLAGPSTVTVYASSTAADVELVATLSDVAPDGTATPVAKAGALIGSQRAEDSSRNWVDAAGLLIRPYHPLQQVTVQAVPVGQTVRYDIEIPPTVWRLGQGHRLQLTLASALINSSTGGPPTFTLTLIPTVPQAAALAGGVYSIQRTSVSPSGLNIPLTSEASLCTSRFAWAPAPQNVSTPLAGAKACPAP